jgi:hypothetical protein
MSIIRDLLDKSASLSAASKYTAINAFVYQGGKGAWA